MLQKRKIRFIVIKEFVAFLEKELGKNILAGKYMWMEKTKENVDKKLTYQLNLELRGKSFRM